MFSGAVVDRTGAGGMGGTGVSPTRAVRVEETDCRLAYAEVCRWRGAGDGFVGYS